MKFTKFAILLGILITFTATVTTASEEATIAIVDFQDMTSDKADLGAQVSENIRTSMASSAYFRTIERSQIETVMEEKKLHYSDMVDPSTASKFGKIVGARYVMVGSITQLGDYYSINARMVDVETAEVVSAAQSKGESLNDLTAMIDELVEQFTGSEKLDSKGFFTAETIFETDFRSSDMGPFEYLGEGKHSIDMKKGILTLGDGKGDGEEMRSAVRAEIDSQYFILEATVRAKRKGAFAIYGRTNDDMATVCRIATGEYIPIPDVSSISSVDYYEVDPDEFLDGFDDITGYLESSGRSELLHPGYGNLALVEMEGAMFLDDAYYHGIPKGSVVIDKTTETSSVRNKTWINVKITYLADEIIAKIGKEELRMTTQNTTPGSLVIAAFDDCILEIAKLKITGL